MHLLKYIHYRQAMLATKSLEGLSEAERLEKDLRDKQAEAVLALVEKEPPLSLYDLGYALMMPSHHSWERLPLSEHDPIRQQILAALNAWTNSSKGV